MPRNRWTILAVLTLVRAAMAYQFQSVASFSRYLMADLGIYYAGLGTLIRLSILPRIVLALPGGLLGRETVELLVQLGDGKPDAPAFATDAVPALAPVVHGGDHATFACQEASQAKVKALSLLTRWSICVPSVLTPRM